MSVTSEAAIEYLYSLDDREHKVTDIAWSPSGKYISVCTSGSSILVWDVEQKHLQKVVSLRRILAISGQTPETSDGPGVQQNRWIPSFAVNTSWSRDGDIFAYVSRMERIAIYDTQCDLPPEELSFRLPGLLRVAWIPYVGQILAITMDGLWRCDLVESALPKKLLDTGFIPYAMEVTPNGDKIAISSHTGAIWVISNPAANAGLLAELEGAEPSTYGLAWCPSGERLAACLGDGTIRIWDFPGNIVVATLKGHSAPCLSVAFSGDGQMLASKSVDDTVRIWNCRNWCETCCVDEPTGKAFGRVGFHPTKPILATRGVGDCGIRIWRIVSNESKTVVSALGKSTIKGEAVVSTHTRGSLVSPRRASSLPDKLYHAAPLLLEMRSRTSRVGQRPRCFISYARGKSKNEIWIEDFALYLREDCQVEVLFDRWHSPPGSSVTKFFDGLSDSEFVIPIGTPEYRAKYDAEDSDPIVDAEIRIINRTLTKRTSARERILPVLLEGEIAQSFPSLFEDSVVVCCRTDAEAREQLPELVAKILGIDFSSREYIEFRRSLGIGIDVY